MNMAKRVFSFFIAFALCAAMSLGSLSFMPKAFAVDDFEFPFSVDDIPGIYKDYSFYIGLVYYSSSTYCLEVYYSNSSFTVLVPSYNQTRLNISSSVAGRIRWDSSSQSFTIQSISGGTSIFTGGIGTPFPFLNQGVSFTAPSSSAFAYSFVTPKQSIPKYWDYVPFYFPQLPYGYFDGHLNSLDGEFNLDLGQLQGTTSSSGNGLAQANLDEVYLYTDGGYLNGGYSGVVSNADANGFSDGFVKGSVTISSVQTSGTWSTSGGSGSLQYQPSYNETARFRTWAVVSASSYCYFVCDTRNTITGSLESVNGKNGRLRFSAVGADGVHYPFFCIEFAFDGTKLQTLQALPNGFTVDFIGGTLEQDPDTGIWSCDPLYHGFWLSDGCPALVLSSLSDETYKWLANPVFGEEAFTLNFLYAINENITGLRSDLTSLQSVMQSSISNQTSTFQNMDAPSATQPDTTDMMNYFGSASAFDAPDTSSMFSGDIKTGHAWQGVTWWSSKFNDIIVANQTIVGFTTAMLTLGLAVLILGRRFSMR